MIELLTIVQHVNPLYIPLIITRKGSFFAVKDVT